MVQAGEHLRDLDSSVIPVLPSRYQYYCSIVPRRGTAFFTVTLHSPKGGTHPKTTQWTGARRCSGFNG